MFVVAVEDSTVLQIDYSTEPRLKQANHHFETFFRIGAERTAAYHQQRNRPGHGQTLRRRTGQSHHHRPQCRNHPNRRGRNWSRSH